MLELKKNKIFLNKATKHKENYMEGLKSINKKKILKMADPLTTRKFHKGTRLLQYFCCNKYSNLMLQNTALQGFEYVLKHTVKVHLRVAQHVYCTSRVHRT